jgi:hypothetical protein
MQTGEGGGHIATSVVTFGFDVYWDKGYLPKMGISISLKKGHLDQRSRCPNTNDTFIRSALP